MVTKNPSLRVTMSDNQNHPNLLITSQGTCANITQVWYQMNEYRGLVTQGRDHPGISLKYINKK